MVVRRLLWSVQSRSRGCGLEMWVGAKVEELCLRAFSFLVVRRAREECLIGEVGGVRVLFPRS